MSPETGNADLGSAGTSVTPSFSGTIDEEKVMRLCVRRLEMRGMTLFFVFKMANCLSRLQNFKGHEEGVRRCHWSHVPYLESDL